MTKQLYALHLRDDIINEVDQGDFPEDYKFMNDCSNVANNVAFRNDYFYSWDKALLQRMIDDE